MTAESVLSIASTNRLAPASGAPKRSSSLAVGQSQPGFRKPGAAKATPTSATALPATPPQAKLIAPSPR